MIFRISKLFPGVHLNGPFILKCSKIDDVLGPPCNHNITSVLESHSNEKTKKPYLIYNSVNL